MLKVVPAVALLLLVVIQTSAYAANCEGQKGGVKFEDDFTDDSGGWAHDPGATSSDASTAREGDFCAEAVMPHAPAAGIIARSGLLFLANDLRNFYALLIGDDGPTSSNQQRGMIGLWRSDGGNWGTLGYWSDPKTKLEPGSVIALRAVAKTNLITASVNGVEVKKVRIQQPGNDLKFGVYVETSQPLRAPGVTFQFKRYKVTSGE